MTIEAHPHERVFTAGVGLGHEPVDDDWSAHEYDHLWFAKAPRQVCRGDHIFALGAGRGSAVLGLFEVTSGGPELLANLWDAARWPWAIGVRPLVAVAPRDAVAISGVIAPRATAARVHDPEQRKALYAAVD